MLYIKNVVFSGESVPLPVLLMTLSAANEVDIRWSSDGATQTVFWKFAIGIAVTKFGLNLWLNDGNISTFNTLAPMVSSCDCKYVIFKHIFVTAFSSFSSHFSSCQHHRINLMVCHLA